MPEELSPNDRRFEEALELMMQLREAPADPARQAAVAQWRARDPAHEQTWAEVAEIQGMAALILGKAPPKRGPSRRGVILGGLGGLMAAGTATLFGPGLLRRARADHATGTGEIRQVVLSDGSQVTLGPDSALRLDYSSVLRRIELLAGMAFFTVAPDTSRPFQALCGALTATALGTAFDLSEEAGCITMSVEAGQVAVTLPGADGPLPEALNAGHWLTLDGDSGRLEQGERDSGQIAAWRDGLLVAERESIETVAARIARWQEGWVIVTDSDFGARRISGVFDLSDPLAALAAVVHPHGGTVRQVSPWITLLSPP